MSAIQLPNPCMLAHLKGCGVLPQSIFNDLGQKTQNFSVGLGLGGLPFSLNLLPFGI